jgi:hypothetical protein
MTALPGRMPRPRVGRNLTLHRFGLHRHCGGQDGRRSLSGSGPLGRSVPHGHGGGRAGRREGQNKALNVTKLRRRCNAAEPFGDIAASVDRGDEKTIFYPPLLEPLDPKHDNVRRAVQKSPAPSPSQISRFTHRWNFTCRSRDRRHGAEPSRSRSFSQHWEWPAACPTALGEGQRAGFVAVDGPPPRSGAPDDPPHACGGLGT